MTKIGGDGCERERKSTNPSKGEFFCSYWALAEKNVKLSLRFYC